MFFTALRRPLTSKALLSIAHTCAARELEVLGRQVDGSGEYHLRGERVGIVLVFQKWGEVNSVFVVNILFLSEPKPPLKQGGWGDVELSVIVSLVAIRLLGTSASWSARPVLPSLSIPEVTLINEWPSVMVLSLPSPWLFYL